VLSLIHTHWSSPGKAFKHRNNNSLTESHTTSITHEWSLLITRQVFADRLLIPLPRRTFRGYLLPRTQNWTPSAVRLWDNYFARTPRKTPPIVVDACLQLSCLATDFLELRVFARRGPHRNTVSILLLPLFVFTELLLGNALIKSVTILKLRGFQREKYQCL
jgi:hypothetical protein